MENPIAPAVEGGPLESEMPDVTFRSRTDQFLGNKVIREEEENVDMEGGGEGGHCLQYNNEAIQTVSVDRLHAKTDRQLKQLHRIGLSI